MRGRRRGESRPIMFRATREVVLEADPFTLSDK